MRDEVREQLWGSIGEEVFDAQFPEWGKLSEETRAAKIAIARDELLRPLARAGYEVRKKGTS